MPYAELPAEDRHWVYDGGDGLTGIRGFFEEVESYRYKLHVRVFLSRYRSQSPCPRCEGRRLRPEALAVRVAGASIAEFGEKTVEELDALFATLSLTEWEATVARDVLKLLRAKLSFLLRVGLGYLTLGRQTRTLSGGEAQRINLANQLGAQLTGTLYVLDEPSIGLHPRDTARLAELCRELAAGGNTVVMVEHDRALIEVADYLIEMGPGSGERGGSVVFAGTQDEFRKDPRSLTARYLSGRDTIPLPLAPAAGAPGPGAGGRAREQPEERHREDPAQHAHLRDRGLGLREVHARARHALSRGGASLQGGLRGARAPTTSCAGCSTSRASASSTRSPSGAPRAPTPSPT